MKQCSSCKTQKPTEAFASNRSRKDGLAHCCRDCTRDHKKISYLKNRENVIAKAKAYRKANLEKCKAKNTEYSQINKVKRNQYNAVRRKVKYATDPQFRAIINARARVGNFLRQKEKYAKSLGCSFETFKQHISSLFVDGMSWENYGQWHIDHIYPLSVAYAQSKESFAKACHYSNLRPLWAKENLQKSNKLIDANLNGVATKRAEG